MILHHLHLEVHWPPRKASPRIAEIVYFFNGCSRGYSQLLHQPMQMHSRNAKGAGGIDNPAPMHK